MRIDRRGFANTAAAADGMTCMQCVYMHRIKRLSGIKAIWAQHLEVQESKKKCHLHFSGYFKHLGAPLGP